LTSQTWLAERLAHFGESPCAFLIGVNSFAAARQRFNLLETMDWFGRQVAWFDPFKLNGTWLGVIG
jgi:hypothetical protein